MSATGPGRPAGRLRRWARAPLVHFLVLGGLAFAVREAAFAPASGHTVIVDAATLADLEAGFRRQTGRAPGPVEREALLRNEVDDRLLLAEAFARGWHRSDAIALRRLIQNQRFLAPDDPASDAEMLERAFEQGMDESDVVVRRRLLERMRLTLQAAARERAPTREQLEGFLSAHPERFAVPEKTRLSHVFLSRDRRGDRLAADARALGERLAAEAIPPARAAALADPLLVRSDLPGWSEARLARELGTAFARGVRGLPVGRWSGPVESAYGLHFVWIHERTPARVPALDEVVDAVRAEWQREQADRALRAALDALRARADVVLPSPPP